MKTNIELLFIYYSYYFKYTFIETNRATNIH